LTKIKRGAQLLYHWQIRKSLTLPYLPTEVGLELTNRCNFKCAFCPQSDPEHFNRVPASAVSPEQARILITKLREGGLDTGIIHWTLDGEPFMNKQFDQVVKVAVELGFHTHHFATNGFFVTPERLRSFPKEGQQYFLTPDFCADEKFFETHRGTPGSWRVVLDNLRAVLDDPGLAHFSFKMTDISAYTITDPDERAKRLQDLRALFPKSNRITFHQRVFHNAAGLVDNGSDQAGSEAKYNLCPYPWFSFIIGSNGDVVACCRDLEHQTVLGNLFQQEFDEIWNGEKYRALRRDLVAKDPGKQAACANCDMPYNSAKFSPQHLVKAAVHRMLIFERN
jgi:radical SAM protein with 4Fe4S-binding SPASM domain